MPTLCSMCGGTYRYCESCRGSWIRATMCRVTNLFSRSPKRCSKVIPISKQP